MRILKSVVLVIASLVAFSCAKAPIEDNGKRELTISISSMPTRSIDGSVADQASTEIKSLYIFLSDGTTVLDRDIMATEESVADFIVNKGKTYDNIPSAVREVVIIANKKTGDSFPLEVGSAVADIKNYAFALISQQPTVANPENKLAAAVTMLGYSNLVDSGETTASGAKKMKAKVVVKPIVGRLEINGALIAGENINEINVEQIWVDNYYKTASYVPANLISNGIEIADYVGNLQTVFGKGSQNLIDITTGTNVDAYHLLSNDTTVEMPYIILKVSGFYTNNTGGQGAAFADKYISINKYNENGGAVSVFKSNNIYKVRLGKLTVKASNLDNNPGAVNVALEVAVEVTPWTSHEITPEI